MTSNVCADGLDNRPCIGSECRLGEQTGIGCSGDLPCPLAKGHGPLLEPVIRDPQPVMSGEDGNARAVSSYVKVAPEGGGYPDGNPKTLAGAKKPDISVVPPAGILHLATAMMNGADKYGPFNWREKPISTRPYVAAAIRHLLAYLDGEEFSADTVEAGKPVHHLGHVMACCAILLDAREIEGGLNDNRPKVKGPAGRMIENYNRTSEL